MSVEMAANMDAFYPDRQILEPKLTVARNLARKRLLDCKTSRYSASHSSARMERLRFRRFGVASHTITEKCFTQESIFPGNCL
jgi:hypothetical protein